MPQPTAKNRRLAELTALAGLTESMNNQSQASAALENQSAQRDLDLVMKMLGYQQQLAEQSAADAYRTRALEVQQAEQAANSGYRDRSLSVQERGLADERAAKEAALAQNNAQFNRKAVLDMVDQMLARGETLDAIQPFLEQIPEFATGFQKRAEGQRQTITSQVQPLVEAAYKKPGTAKEVVDALYQSYGVTPVGRQALDNLPWGDYNSRVPAVPGSGANGRSGFAPDEETARKQKERLDQFKGFFDWLGAGVADAFSTR